MQRKRLVTEYVAVCDFCKKEIKSDRGGARDKSIPIMFDSKNFIIDFTKDEPNEVRFCGEHIGIGEVLQYPREQIEFALELIRRFDKVTTKENES